MKVKMPSPTLQIEPVDLPEAINDLNPTVGINKIVYEEDHDYLKDL